MAQLATQKDRWIAGEYDVVVGCLYVFASLRLLYTFDGVLIMGFVQARRRLGFI